MAYTFAFVCTIRCKSFFIIYQNICIKITKRVHAIDIANSISSLFLKYLQLRTLIYIAFVIFCLRCWQNDKYKESHNYLGL
ncbi:unnamed protein product [Blepharisma stoltei]|uniref:Uncharacterized protein n=1 Tax=Blepharisma stoltei TaxID=1481888 RepID=A0AAU9J6R5_9CILI|nr:unnamed protein product [Blepharisma stoltei]